MPVVTNLTTGQEEYLLDSEAAAAIERGTHALRGDQKLSIQDRQGEVKTVTGESYEKVWRHEGATGADQRAVSDKVDQYRKEDEHGGTLKAIGTGLLSAANSASLGTVDAVGGLIGGDDYRTWRKENQEVHDTADLIGEVGGYLAPTGLAKAPGLIGKAAKYSPVGLAERAGQKIAARGLEKSAVKQIGYAGAGLAAEGAAVGLGESLSEYSLATSDLEREQAIGNVSSNVMFGATAGGVIGASTKGVGLAIKKGKKVADGMVAKADEQRALGSLSDDVASLDKEGIRVARASEQELISEQIFEGATSYRQMADEIDPMLLGVEKKEFLKAKTRINAALKNPKKFKSAPGKAIEESLQIEEQALKKVLAQKDDLIAKLAEKDSDLLKKLGKLDDGVLKGKDLTSRYNDFAGTYHTGKEAVAGIDVGIDELARFRRALEQGEAMGARQKALDRLPDMLAANQAQQDAITALKNGATPRLTELRIAEDALSSAPKEVKSIAQKIGEGAVLSGVTGGLGAVGVPWTAAAVIGASASEKLSSLIFGKLGKAAKKTAGKTSGYVDTFLNASAKVGQVAPPLATKILAGVRFGDEDKADRSFHKSELAKAFKAREAELYAQVTMGANGITMKPAARQKVADQLAGVRLASPQLADSMETMINRRLAFLAKKIPKRPDYMQDSVGPDTWAPSNQEIRGWARYVAAAEDPSGVEERLSDGTLTPEDVEAYREVYPERYLDIRQQIATRLPELQATLPIVKRIALSLFTDLDVEPALHPVIFGRLQAQYGEEPGTEGGSQAPVPQADFGAFGTNRSADKLKTPSQQRT